MSTIINVNSNLTSVNDPRQGKSPAVEPQRRADSAARHSIDSVEFSDRARELAQAAEKESIQTPKVQRIRVEISAGSFETPERIDGTVDRLLAALQNDA